MSKYVYTASKLATSTCERKFARIIPPSMIANMFTIWTTDETDMAFVTPTTTEYTTLYRSPNNRATRKELARQKAVPVSVLANGCLA